MSSSTYDESKMSLLTKTQRISVPQFASVPLLGDLPTIQRAPASVSNVSTREGVDVDLAEEGCMVTKCIKYTHQLAYWIDVVDKGDPSIVVSN
jgi:hypothetical protein